MCSTVRRTRYDSGGQAGAGNARRRGPFETKCWVLDTTLRRLGLRSGPVRKRLNLAEYIAGVTSALKRRTEANPQWILRDPPGSTVLRVAVGPGD